MFRPQAIFSIVLLLLTTFACKPGTPRGVLSRSKMEAVLYDYHMAQSMAEMGDSMEQRRYAYILAVFDKHGITEAEFDSSMVWYSANSYELRDIYARLAQRIETEAEAAGVSHDDWGTASITGDTTQLWPGHMLYCLQRTHTSHTLHVTLPADSMSRKGDEYLWRFDAVFLQKEGRRNATATLVLRHEGDSVTATSRTISTNGRLDLRLTQARTLSLRQVDCYIHMPMADGAGSAGQLIIMQPRLVRFHSKY